MNGNFQPVPEYVKQMRASRESRILPAATPASDTAILGIGGIGIFAENEKPTIPTARQIERMERLDREAIRCRICGQTDIFDGAMFTTIRGGDICDDCL